MLSFMRPDAIIIFAGRKDAWAIQKAAAEGLGKAVFPELFWHWEWFDCTPHPRGSMRRHRRPRRQWHLFLPLSGWFPPGCLGWSLHSGNTIRCMGGPIHKPGLQATSQKARVGYDNFLYLDWPPYGCRKDCTALRLWSPTTLIIKE